MSHDEPPTMSKREQLLAGYMIWIWLAPVLPLLILIVYFALSSPAAPTTSKSSRPGKVVESNLDTARQSLTRQTDLKTCHVTLRQINAEMSEKPEHRPPALTEKEKDWLQENLSLSDEELSEVKSSLYTRLDGYHLFRCFLMRDVAGALEVKGVRRKAGGQPVREKPLDRAARAFAWVMREVRLRQQEGEAAPPSFVVRRGWANALERALIFLALLEQLGEPDADQPELLGFLLQIPDDSGGTRLWACGVVVGDGKEVYLFDPHLGLPLPGPKGEGIATLAQAREQPEILAQLNVAEKIHYPVTAELARQAQVELVCPLSALSPRMRYLQEKLLAPAVRVRLATDGAAAQERVKTACAAGAKKPASMIVARNLCTVLRRFLPAEEGGSDSTSWMHRFSRELVPMHRLPSVFRDERIFPRNSRLGQLVLGQFVAFFYHPTMEPDQARDQLLRGRYSSAVPVLVSERDSWRQQLVQRVNAVDLEKRFQESLDKATGVYARLYRAKQAKQPQEIQQAEQQVKTWENKESYPIFLVLNSSAAAARMPEVDYQLALCAQEQAGQVQARLDLQTQVGATPHQLDIEKARSGWENTLSAWKRFDEDYPKHPDRSAARRQRGRAEAMLGEHKAAIASWKNVSGFQIDLEKLASLYLARQWEKKHPQ